MGETETNGTLTVKSSPTLVGKHNVPHMIRRLAITCANASLTPIDGMSRQSATLELQDYLSSGRLASAFLCQTSSSSDLLVAKIIDLGICPVQHQYPDEMDPSSLSYHEAILAARHEIEVYAHLVDLQGSVVPRFIGAYQGTRLSWGFTGEMIVLVMQYVGPPLQLSTLTDEGR